MVRNFSFMVVRILVLALIVAGSRNAGAVGYLFHPAHGFFGGGNGGIPTDTDLHVNSLNVGDVTGAVAGQILAKSINPHGGDPTLNNIVLGDPNSLQNNTTGLRNFAAGHNALFANTSGSSNIAIGEYALEDNTTGRYNFALGRYVLDENLSGDYNLGIIQQALTKNTTGGNNIALGRQALYSNVDGSDNGGMGYRVLQDNVSGIHNWAFGHKSLNNTTGSGNLGIGAYSGYANTSLDDQIFIGGWDGSTQYPADHRWEVTAVTAQHHVDDFQVNRDTYTLPMVHSIDGLVVTTCQADIFRCTDADATAKTGTVTLTGTESFIPVDASGGNVVLDLPAASGLKGQPYTVVSMEAQGANSITIDAAGAETINGALTCTVLDAQWKHVTITCTGTQWIIVGGNY